MAQIIVFPPSKHKVLLSTPSTITKKEKEIKKKPTSVLEPVY